MRVLPEIGGYLSILWGAFLLRAGFARPPRDSVEFFAYRRRWNQAIQKRFGIDIAWSGPEPKPGTLLVSNHFGFTDILALICASPAEAKLNFVSKIEIGNVPIFGWQMRHYGDVLFDRKSGEGRRQALYGALARLDAGCSVALFPEGTRSKTGAPKPEVRPALIDTAIARGFLVQPVGVAGSFGVLESVWAPKRGVRLRVRFGTARKDFPDSSEVWRQTIALWREAEDARG